MKLLYIVNARMPTEKAYGYQIGKMCEEFASMGIEVELWISARTGYIREDVFTFYGLKNNFKIKKIRGLSSFKLRYKLEKLIFWLNVLSAAVTLFFKKIDRDAVVYARDPEICRLFKLRGHAVVLESHSWPGSKIGLYKFLIKKIDKVILITHSLKKKYLNIGFPEERILVAPDGVDMKRFNIKITKKQARKKLSLPPDKKLAVYTGHLYEWKGAQVLADAAKYLKEDEIIVFVGGLKSYVEKFKERNKEFKNVLTIGQVKHSQVPFYLKSADVLVLPNSAEEAISRFYTSPLKLFEYMASERPVVASDLPSMREILDKDNCVFVQPDDPESLAGGIRKVLDNQDLAKRIAKQAIWNVQEHTWQKRAEKIISFIA